jgi:hypothetical protein
MTDKERETLRLLYDFHIELLQYQALQIQGLQHAVAGAAQAIDAVKKSQEVLVKLMKATGDLMGVN